MRSESSGAGGDDQYVAVAMHVIGGRPGALAWVAVATAAGGFAACLVGWLAGGVAVDLPWAPTLGLRLDLALDGLGALYALLATGIGAAVFAYGAAYLPWHLEHDGRPAALELRRSLLMPSFSCCSRVVSVCGVTVLDQRRQSHLRGARLKLVTRKGERPLGRVRASNRARFSLRLPPREITLVSVDRGA
jgi:hypothetical protein